MSMDCGQVRAALRRSEVPKGADAAAHLAECPACATLCASPELVRALEAETSREAPGVDALLARTLGRVDDERGPMTRMRELASSTRYSLALVVAVLVPIAVLVATPRPDLGVVPRDRFATSVLLYAIPAAAALLLALRPLQRATSTRVRVVVVALGVLAAIAIAALPEMHTGHPAATIEPGAFGRRALACLAFGTLTAVPIFAALRMLAREGPRVGAKALVLAIAAALAGSLAVFLHCPITHPGHLWAGHVSVLVPAVLWALMHVRR
jgi:hypothetical protein